MAPLKYLRIKTAIEGAIEAGVFTTKLPSVRVYAAKQGVSISTIQKAYQALEREGKIFSIVKKGYFVRETPTQPSSPYGQNIQKIYTGEILEHDVLHSLNDDTVLPLSSTAPSSVVNNEYILNKHHKRAFLADTYRFNIDDEVQGSQRLRKALSQFFYNQGIICKPSSIHITSGRKEGLLVALLATKSVGSSIAIESPSSFYFQAAVKQLCHEVIEVPMQNDYHQELDLLEQAYQKYKFNAYLVNANFNDPTGRVIAEQHKIELIQWAISRNVTLIEYDRGELYFGSHRPPSLAVLARSLPGAKIISIQDFFDTISTRINLGFIIGINTNTQIHYAKHTTTEDANFHVQNLVTSLLLSGEYEKMLVKLRSQLYRNYLASQDILAAHIAGKASYNGQSGGPCLWIKLNDDQSSITLWKKLIAQGVAIAPGTMFSFTGQFEQYFRITFALPWNTTVASGITKLCKAI